MKILLAALTSVAAASIFALSPALAAEPDGLVLPPGFHATVVADGLGNAVRHMAFRDASTLYVSTDRPARDAADVGLIAVHLDKNHKADKVEHFSDVDNGTNIHIYKGALYAGSASAIYRFKFAGKELVPTAPPETVVDNIPRRSAVAFDDKGGMYVAVGGSGNLCVDPKAPKEAVPVGLNPCPYMDNRAGIWRFDADKTGQHFLQGEHFATGIRDLNAMAWKPGVGLYTVMYGRDATEKNFPDLVSAADGQNIADEMFLVGKDTDMGWPYTYWDSARKIRLKAPEYGGDAKTAVTDLKYAVPVAAFTAHVAPQDILFYNASQFPAEYRGGAFIPFHGAGGDDLNDDVGFNLGFVPMDKTGHAKGPVRIFAGGFAGADKSMRNGKKAAYRPMGVAVAPDGSLYVSDSQKGRIWRIAYGR